MPLAQLTHYPGNPRRHNHAALVDSLSAHGQIRPLVVQRSTKIVLTGNGTMDAAEELGWNEIAVLYVDVDDDQGKRINLVDNRTSDVASYDMGDLADLLQSVEGDLTGTGFTMDDLEDLVALVGDVPQTDAEPFAGELQPNEQRDPPKVPLTKSGLKEVVLVLRLDELAKFERHVDQLGRTWGTETVTATVLEALRRAGPARVPRKAPAKKAPAKKR